MKCRKCGRGNIVDYIPPLEILIGGKLYYYPYPNPPQKCGYCGELYV